MKINVSIISSTHVDRQGDRMAKEALESMARQIKSKYIPVDVEHRGTYIGVILSAKIKPFEDGEWALFAVSGIFEDGKEKEDFSYGSPNIVFEKYLKLLDDLGDKPWPARSKEEIEKEDELIKMGEQPMGFSVGFREVPSSEGNNIVLKIYSDRDSQRAIQKSLKEEYPDLNPEVIVRKSLSDASQIIQLFLSEASLLIQIISLAIQIGAGQEKKNSKFKIEIKKGNKTLKIEADQKADIGRIVRDFLKKSGDSG